MEAKIQAFIDSVKVRNGNEPEFIQAVTEVAETVLPFIENNPKYNKSMLLERMVEPERVIMFRVPWLDDKGKNSEWGPALKLHHFLIYYKPELPSDKPHRSMGLFSREDQSQV